YDPEASTLESVLHHSQHASVAADFGVLPEDLELTRPIKARTDSPSARKLAVENHLLAGGLTTSVGALGIAFAFLMYYYRLLSPADAKQHFPAVHRLLWNNGYFDELYSVLWLRPAFTLAGWCRGVDT